MLRTLLDTLDRTTGPITHADLARAAGIDPAMVQPLLDHLVRTGHLAPDDDATGCGGCAADKCRTCPLPVRLPVRVTTTS